MWVKLRSNRTKKYKGGQDGMSEIVVQYSIRKQRESNLSRSYIKSIIYLISNQLYMIYHMYIRII